MTLTPPDPRAAMVVANVSGGKQFELFDTEPDPGCLRWGLCEVPDDD
ncbi:hypothetical protein K0U83_27345 [bacterium]|nr:hypothetical protein [bacterium]